MVVALGWLRWLCVDHKDSNHLGDDMIAGTAHHNALIDPYVTLTADGDYEGADVARAEIARLDDAAFRALRNARVGA